MSRWTRFTFWLAYPLAKRYGKRNRTEAGGVVAEVLTWRGFWYVTEFRND